MPGRLAERIPAQVGQQCEKQHQQRDRFGAQKLEIDHDIGRDGRGDDQQGQFTPHDVVANGNGTQHGRDTQHDADVDDVRAVGVAQRKALGGERPRGKATGVVDADGGGHGDLG